MPLTFGVVERLVLGIALAAFVSIQSHRRGSLTDDGQWAAFATGTVAVAAGWRWAILLFLFYSSSTLLTRYGMTTKRARTEAINEPERAREASQVLANGGVFTVAALGSLVLGGDGWWWLGAGAMAAACADTWATEIGTLWGGEPRSIVGGEPLPVGMSGGVTTAGWGGVMAGALFIAVSAWAMDPSATGEEFLAVLLGGTLGAATDSLLGATVQTRRWCPVCHVWTERWVHTCLYRTSHRRGIRWLNNDLVNGAATTAGGAAAWVAWVLLSG